MVLRLVAAVLLMGSVAYAQADKPWAAGVSASDQKAALDKYQSANGLFEDGKYREALPLYQDALALWDHPGIHFNAAVCLMNLERIVEAYEHFEKALAYGDAPLGKPLYNEGKNYLRLLKQQVGTLEIVCETNCDGAEVSLDGKPLFVGPNKATRKVLSTEPHQIVATKPRFEIEQRTIQLEPDKTTTLVLELKLQQRGKLQRRWPRAVPWIVMSAGVVVAGSGGFFLWRAKDGFEAYDRAFADDPICRAGCLASDEPQYLVDQRQRAERQQTTSTGLFVAGGVTVAAGLVMVVLNQPRLVGGGEVKPTVGRDQAGATITWTW
jgi:tetratricopeptide (TPR) repeat protein